VYYYLSQSVLVPRLVYFLGVCKTVEILNIFGFVDNVLLFDSLIHQFSQ